MIVIKIDLVPEYTIFNFYPASFGYMFRAAIMEWLKKHKPELAHEFHAPNKIRPYALKVMRDPHHPIINLWVTTYHEKLSNLLIHEILKAEEKIQIGKYSCSISKVEFRKVDLKKIIQNAKPVINFTLLFNTPTYFGTSRGGYPVRFPLPEPLFVNLTQLWNDIMGHSSGIDANIFINWVNAHVYVSSYRMETRRINIGKAKPIAGGIGSASYSVNKIHEKYYVSTAKDKIKQEGLAFIRTDYSNNCRWLEILCNLGELCNVGKNKTAGMGQIFYKPQKHLAES